MGELVESAGGVLAALLLIGFVLWVLHYVFGSQVFGLPAMIGVLVVIAVGSAVPSLGVLSIAAIAAGVLVLFAVIGIAMSLGPEKLPKAHDEKPKDG
jgi:hypothetical protein